MDDDLKAINADLAEIRADLREIRRNRRIHFRVLLGSVIVFYIGLASLMAAGFNWL